MYSKTDNTREEAADACKRLAQKINKSQAVELLLNHIFGVFSGSDGKLTVIDHKLNVLQVIIFKLRRKFRL